MKVKEEDIYFKLPDEELQKAVQDMVLCGRGILQVELISEDIIVKHIPYAFTLRDEEDE
jgi:hypothetical protein